ncbi:polysaccharide biosynthesis/export family protein [Arcticibacter sp. MXS-1]|uniref:polysaccharide biosynthesis/export family protein n=1 Tax=Arcticibacter sp. MXS-1 TaxID=3341726 RepID=UPI0035A8F6EB
MLKPLTVAIYRIAMALSFVCLISSCSIKRVAYFQDIPDTTKGRSVATAEFIDPVIVPDDVLSISIQTIDPQASAALNQTPATSGGAQTVSGYLVDKLGNVEVPMLGILKLAGLTTAQAREKIRQEASKFYRDPTVQVRFANYRITVLGEVNRPSTFIVPSEKVSVLDAIAMAGDITIFSKMKNVMLIRDNGDKKDIYRMDLTSSKLMQSPNFYLKKNDVLYVEANKDKVAAGALSRTRFITIGLSIVSVAISIITRL